MGKTFHKKRTINHRNNTTAYNDDDYGVVKHPEKKKYQKKIRPQDVDYDW